MLTSINGNTQEELEKSSKRSTELESEVEKLTSTIDKLEKENIKFQEERLTELKKRNFSNAIEVIFIGCFVALVIALIFYLAHSARLEEMDRELAARTQAECSSCAQIESLICPKSCNEGRKDK